jgi:hypothetical protein
MKIAFQSVVLALVAYISLFAPMPTASANTPVPKANGRDSGGGGNEAFIRSQITALLAQKTAIETSYGNAINTLTNSANQLQALADNLRGRGPVFSESAAGLDRAVANILATIVRLTDKRDSILRDIDNKISALDAQLP